MHRPASWRRCVVTKPPGNNSAREVNKRMWFETGQTVPESGSYENEHGVRRVFTAGIAFPRCPDHGTECRWTKAGRVLHMHREAID